ncbi:hypothetical protein MED222_06060 [Vibrio sp. MED222]|nr:hypothetical protein MED222_06060 [Vibrio sp. MED222]
MKTKRLLSPGVKGSLKPRGRYLSSALTVSSPML